MKQLSRFRRCAGRTLEVLYWGLTMCIPLFFFDKLAGMKLWDMRPGKWLPLGLMLVVLILGLSGPLSARLRRGREEGPGEKPEGLQTDGSPENCCRTEEDLGSPEELRELSRPDVNDEGVVGETFRPCERTEETDRGLASPDSEEGGNRGKRRKKRRVKRSGKYSGRELSPRHLLLALLIDIYAFLVMELVNNPDFYKMEWGYRALNVLGIFLITIILFFWLNSFKRAVGLVLVIWTLFAIIFRVVYTFRGEPLQLIDFYSIGTAAEVAGGYHFETPPSILLSVTLSLIFLGLLGRMKDARLARGVLPRILMRVGIILFMIGGYHFYLNVNWNGGLGILTDLFAPLKTYREYGTTVGFFCVSKYMKLSPPEGYSLPRTREIAERAGRIREEGGRQKKEATGSNRKPVNIIAIMNESWADYRRIGDLRTNQEVMPYFDSMEDNTIKGYTMVCITGGGTAKSEYEFLTGNSVKRFPAMVPYVSYFTHDQHSLVSTLEAQGYRSAAMHPYVAKNWNRPAAYRLLGFDRFYSQEDYDPSAEKIHGHISDRANYEKILELIRTKKSPEEPFFLFDVTMQNHGGYADSRIRQEIRVDNYHSDVVDNFLSLEKKSDDALRYLIESLEDVDQPTMVLMFGDHYPTMPEGFTELLSGKKYDSLSPSEQVRFYETPFFIWANYDIDERKDVLTSNNFLGTLMLEQTGLEMPDYNYYLQELYDSRLAGLNHMGYYDPDGSFHTWAEGSEEALRAEWDYECLQYNNLAEKRKRLDDFFTLTGKS